MYNFGETWNLIFLVVVKGGHERAMSTCIKTTTKLKNFNWEEGAGMGGGKYYKWGLSRPFINYNVPRVLALHVHLYVYTRIIKHVFMNEKWKITCIKSVPKGYVWSLFKMPFRPHAHTRLIHVCIRHHTQLRPSATEYCTRGGTLFLYSFSLDALCGARMRLSREI